MGEIKKVSSLIYCCNLKGPIWISRGNSTYEVLWIENIFKFYLPPISHLAQESPFRKFTIVIIGIKEFHKNSGKKYIEAENLCWFERQVITIISRLKTIKKGKLNGRKIRPINRIICTASNFHFKCFHN